MLHPPPLTARDEAIYPAPVSEYAEQTGPNTMTFLSYPKYYRTASGNLTEVDTTLVESTSADWDYEVTTGIWTLRVRTDGTFQAEHEGNVFTYRLHSIGLGRGNGYKPFAWGEANWSNVSVMGDTIRWAGVFPDVDLSVRYIHDILKLDVILQRALMDRIRADVNNGFLNREEYLTARFDIPNALVTGEARQGGRIRDIFAEPFELNQPLEILKKDKVVHKIRPVETYVIDDQGREIIMDESPIRSAQWWQLRKNGPGVAEMSALLGDMADAPEGNVVMDPSIIFTGEGFYGGGDIYDSYLDQAVPEGMYGSNSYLYLKGNVNQEQRIIMGICHSATKIAGANIQSATLSLYTNYISGTPSNATACAYKNTRNWYCSSVRWSNDGFNGPGSAWTGGEYTTNYQGNHVRMPTTTGWMEFNLSQAFKSHYATYTYDTGDKGFLIKLVNTPSAYWRICASEYVTPASRPFLTVKCAATDYGVHIFPNSTEADGQPGRMERAAQDYFQFLRYVDEKDVAIGWLPTYCGYAKSYGLKVFIHAPVANQCFSATAPIPHLSKDQYAQHIYDLLYIGKDYINDRTIFGIEIGGEESDCYGSDPKDPRRLWWENNRTTTGWYFGNQVQGASFAVYYLAARNRIKNSTFASWKNLEIWSGGTPEKHESLTYSESKTIQVGSAREFIKGFIARCISEATSTGLGYYDFLPDTISMHGYTGRLSPEYTASDIENVTEWFKRVESLYTISDEKGYIPNFAVTEYGFSPIACATNIWAPLNATETSQAVYYLRSSLMNATMQPFAGIGWGRSVYFSHNAGKYDDGIVFQDFGFHNRDFVDQYLDKNIFFGSHRAIKHIARALYATTVTSPTPALKLKDPYTKIWVPTKNEWNPYTTEGLAWCGWETQEGQKWGAIWRYKWSESYVTFVPTSKSFTIQGDVSNAWKITKLYSLSINPGQAIWSITDRSSNPIYGTYASGVTSFSIPNVMQNPIIVIFDSQ